MYVCASVPVVPGILMSHLDSPKMGTPAMAAVHPFYSSEADYCDNNRRHTKILIR